MYWLRLGAFAVVVLLSNRTHGATLRVPSAAYPTVSNAYAAAVIGDVIEVEGGLRLETPELRLTDPARQVTLRAASGQRAILVNNQAPTNDEPSGNLRLTGASAVVSAYNYTASLSPLEQSLAPRFANDPNHLGRTLWWSWQAPRDGVVVISVSSPAQDLAPTVDVYTGLPPGLEPLPLNELDLRKANQLSFFARASAVYYLAVAAEENLFGQLVLEVQMPERPANDDFEAALPLMGDSAQGRGYNYQATGQQGAGEPVHGAMAAGRSIWFSWTAPQDGIQPDAPVRLTTAGSDFDTVLAVYRGNSLANLSAPIAFNNDTTNLTTIDRYSTLTFTNTPGVAYHIVVDGTSIRGRENSVGNVQLTLDYSAVDLSISPRSPLTRTVLPGSRAAFAGLVFAENFTTNRAGALRVRVVGRSGVTRSEVHRGSLTTASNLGIFALSPNFLPPRQQGLVSLAVTSPPTFYDVIRARTNIWGLTALLEENLGSDWLPIDSVFLGYGPYGAEDDDGGLSTGAPRPPLLITNLEESVRVQFARIDGTNIVFDQSVWDFFALAVCSDGTNRWVTNATWSLPPGLTISSDGLLTIPEAANTTTNRVTTVFTFNRKTYANAMDIVIYRRPRVTLLSAANPGMLGLQLLGELGRTYTLERSSDLSATNWSMIHSNRYDGTPVNIFEPMASGAKRFYRGKLIP